jgi:hypothetical protein
VGGGFSLLEGKKKASCKRGEVDPGIDIWGCISLRLNKPQAEGTHLLRGGTDLLCEII